MLHLEAIEPATLELLKRLQALPVFLALTALRFMRVFRTT